MKLTKVRNFTAVVALCGLVAACGESASTTQTADVVPNLGNQGTQRSTIWSVFNTGNKESSVLVNKYLWSATLQVLDFLPIQTVDPFTGVIVTGYGTPPGGGRSYRATVLIDDPALDARSLNVALQSRGGAVSKATSRAVEDAILSRARELHIVDNKF